MDEGPRADSIVSAQDQLCLRCGHSRRDHIASTGKCLYNVPKETGEERQSYFRCPCGGFLGEFDAGLEAARVQ